MNAKATREERLGRLRERADTWVGAAQNPSAESAAVIEVAFLMAAADGVISDAEFDQLTATIEHVTARNISPAGVRLIIKHMTDTLTLDGWEGRLVAAAQNVWNPLARRNAYRFAAGVSFIDGSVQEEEARLFALLAEAFEIPLDEASALLMEVRDYLYGGSELTNPVILLTPDMKRM